MNTQKAHQTIFSNEHRYPHYMHQNIEVNSGSVKTSKQKTFRVIMLNKSEKH